MSLCSSDVGHLRAEPFEVVHVLLPALKVCSELVEVHQHVR